MSKLSMTEQEFQEWLAKFRSGQPCSPIPFLALPTQTDDRLRVLWKDARRRQRKLARDEKVIAEARAAHAAEWAKRKAED
jgi:hypothetical protein